MGKIMYMNKEFQGRIPRVSGEIIYEEDYDYEWDFTRNDHPELDINHGERIRVYSPSNISYNNSGLLINAGAGVTVPLGNTNVIYWDQPGRHIGKTVEIDIVEITGINKPLTPSSANQRNYKRMFMFNGMAAIERNADGKYILNFPHDKDRGLLYTQKSTPENSGWAFYEANNSWTNTVTPEEVAYDSIGYFNNKTLKFEFTGEKQSSRYLFNCYVDDIKLHTGPFDGDTTFAKEAYMPTMIIHDSGGMGGILISGIRVYKNEWYEPKFQPES